MSTEDGSRTRLHQILNLAARQRGLPRLGGPPKGLHLGLPLCRGVLLLHQRTMWWVFLTEPAKPPHQGLPLAARTCTTPRSAWSKSVSNRSGSPCKGDLCTSTCPMYNPRGHYLRAGSGPRNLRPPRIEPTPGFEPETFRLQGGCTNRLCYVGETLTSVPVHHRRPASSSGLLLRV